MNQVRGSEIWENWMGYISDSCPLSDVVIPGSHNAGAVNVTFMFELPLEWLNCQLDGAYKQCMYGCRYFDIRIQMIDEEFYCCHGVGTGIKFELFLTELRRFVTDHPTEFVCFSIRSYYYPAEFDVPQLRAIMDRTVDYTHLAIPGGFDFTRATMGELRATGARFAIECEWIDVAYNNKRPQRDTYTDQANVGNLDDGPRLYSHLRDVLLNGKEKYSIATNRNSGASMEKHTPENFMISDRVLFREFMDEVDKNPEMQKRMIGAGMDCVTLDYVQTGRVLLVNASKGLVKPEKKDEFVKGIHDVITASNGTW
jgi:hypothetical protein